MEHQWLRCSFNIIMWVLHWTKQVGRKNLIHGARTLHAFDDVFWGSGERRITVEATLDCEDQAWPASHHISRDANARSLVRISNRLWGWKIFVYLWWCCFVWSVSTSAWPTFDSCLYAIRGNLMTGLLTNVRMFTGSFLGWHPVRRRKFSGVMLCCFLRSCTRVNINCPAFVSWRFVLFFLVDTPWRNDLLRGDSKASLNTFSFSFSRATGIVWCVANWTCTTFSSLVNLSHSFAVRYSEKLI